MPRRPRSLKQEMDQLSAHLRGQGDTWAEVAQKFQNRWKLNARRAFREAHRYTQSKVAEIWNSLWPDEPLTVRKLGSWEAWPDRSGHEPSIGALNKLARVYECRTRDLVDGEDHRPDTDMVSDHRTTPLVMDNLDVRDVCGVLSALPSIHVGSGIPLGSLRDQEYDALVEALTIWASRIKRRDVLALIGAAATAAAASPSLPTVLDESELHRIALVTQNPSRIDAATISHVESVLHHCMRQEDALGPGAVLETVLAQHHLVRSLLGSGPSQELRERLLSLLSNICRFTGWVLFNLNDFTGADYYYGQARTAAHEADNDVLNSFVLSNWSHLASWRGDPRQGVEHALGALAWGQRAGSKLLTSYASDVGARAYSAVLRRSAKADRRTDHVRCMKSLDQAMRDLSVASGDDPGKELLYFYSDNQHLTTKSRCLLDIGDAHAALDLASQSLAATDPAFVRNVAFSRLYLAQAHLQLKSIDLACQEITEVARLSSQNTSPRLARSILQSREALNPWAKTAAVRELDEELHTFRISA